MLLSELQNFALLQINLWTLVGFFFYSLLSPLGIKFFSPRTYSCCWSSLLLVLQQQGWIYNTGKERFLAMRTLKTRYRLSAVAVEFPSLRERVKQTSVRHDLPVVKPASGQGDGLDDLWALFWPWVSVRGLKQAAPPHAWLWPGLSCPRAHILALLGKKPGEHPHPA